MPWREAHKKQVNLRLNLIYVLPKTAFNKLS